MADWSLDIEKYAKKLGVKVQKVKKTYAFALYSSIVKKTPVDTGRARANWNISVGKVDTSTTTATRKSPKPISSMPEPKGDESIFISNNLDYITKLEYGGYPNPPKSKTGKTVGGYSKQAPNGMVGVTLANNKAIFDAAVKRVKEGKSD